MAKRTGIITFHNANNYGAVLQAFALQTRLEKLGSKVDIINYDSSFMNLKYYQTQLFSNFNNKYLNLTKEYLDADSINVDEFDLLISGSDQVWNPTISEMDNTYFFHGKNKDRKIIASYAASIGIVGEELEQYRDFFSESLTNFDYISLREPQQKEFIEAITHKPVNVNIDPTLLLDMNDYEQYFNIEKKNDDYIFFYSNFLDKRIIDFVNLLSLSTGMKVISVSRFDSAMFTKGAKSYYQINPIDWINYIASANIVITDSFHGLMFSLIFEKPFYVYTKRRDNVSRITEVLDRYNLSDRKLCNIGTIDEVNYSVDFSIKREKVKLEQMDAFSYLSNLLK